MEFSLKIQPGMSLTLEPSDENNNIKVKIQGVEGISLEKRRLLAGKQPKVGSTLGVESSDTNNNIKAKIQGKEVLGISLEKRRLLAGKQPEVASTLGVESSDTNNNIKVNIQGKEGIPLEKQRLLARKRPEVGSTLGVKEDIPLEKRRKLLAGKQLEDDSTLPLALRIRGSSSSMAVEQENAENELMEKPHVKTLLAMQVGPHILAGSSSSMAAEQENAENEVLEHAHVKKLLAMQVGPHILAGSSSSMVAKQENEALVKKFSAMQVEPHILAGSSSSTVADQENAENEVLVKKILAMQVGPHILAGCMRTSSISMAAEQVAAENEQANILPAVGDEFDGVWVEVNSPMDPEIFGSSLGSSVSHWEQQGKKFVYIKLPNGMNDLVEQAKKEGFCRCFADRTYTMLAYQIPVTNSTATHRVGIGAFVMNEERKVLMVQEKSGEMVLQKLPNRVVDKGEDIRLAAEKLVREETGIKTKFVQVLVFRDIMEDMFLLCELQPFGIQKQELKIGAATWMPLEEYAAQPYVQNSEFLKYINDVCRSKIDGTYTGFLRKASYP